MKQETLDKLTLLQDSLNEIITPDWKKNRTELDFMIANMMESAELIDTKITDNGVDYSLGWKWWKGKAGERTMDSVDWDNMHEGVKNNIKIELTDQLFFTLSQKVLGDMSDPLEETELNSNDWVNFVTITAMNLLQRPGTALKMILLLSEKIEFNISAYYCAKHTLNVIRQLNGYKDGSYVKVNEGVEDNELLHDIIKGITIEDMDVDFNTNADKIFNGVYDAFNVATTDRLNMVGLSEIIVGHKIEDLIPHIGE